MRAAYNDPSNAFLEDDIEVKEPYDLFSKWFEEIKQIPSIVEPNAMCLSTATK